MGHAHERAAWQVGDTATWDGKQITIDAFEWQTDWRGRRVECAVFSSRSPVGVSTSSVPLRSLRRPPTPLAAELIAAGKL